LATNTPELVSGIILTFRTQQRRKGLGGTVWASVILTEGDQWKGAGSGSGDTGREARDAALADAYARYPKLFQVEG